MIKKTTLENIELTGNYLIVKPDPNFDFIKLQGPDGEVKIQLAYNPQDETKHVSISGEILKAPENLSYYREELMSGAISAEERASLMRNSMQYKTELSVKVGDKIFFDYHNQFQAEEEGRLIEIDGHGICMLMGYDTFYGKQVDGEFIPLNGWVVFKRDQKEPQYKTDSGLLIIQSVNVYQSNIGFVVAADRHLSGYLDKGYETELELPEGTKILIDSRFGYRIAYSVHAGEMKDYEIIRRKNILGTFD